MHHSAEPDLASVLHRNLSPSSIRRRSNNKPIFTDFMFAQLPGAATVASLWQPRDEVRPYTAPEILESGLSVASRESDVFALCASLVPIFDDIADPHASLALEHFAPRHHATEERLSVTRRSRPRSSRNYRSFVAVGAATDSISLLGRRSCAARFQR